MRTSELTEQHMSPGSQRKCKRVGCLSRSTAGSACLRSTGSYHTHTVLNPSLALPLREGKRRTIRVFAEVPLIAGSDSYCFIIR